MILDFIKKSKNLITASEKKYVFWLILATLVISCIPVVYGWLSTSEGYHYTGFSVIAGSDKMVYLSEMEEARQGKILFSNLYTSESNKSIIFSPVWLILGLIAKVTNLPKILIFQLCRLILGAIFLYLVYLFISRCFERVRWRKLSFFAICLGSGLGVFSLNAPWTSDNMFNTFGTDLWVSEGNTFLTVYHSALFILSQMLILLFFWWLIERLSEAKWLEASLIGLVLLFLGIFHPYDLIIIYAVGGIWFACICLKNKKIDWLGLGKLLIILLISGLAFGYFLWLKMADPAFAVWAVQNITVSPRIFNYAVGYGLVFIFYLFGIYPALKNKNSYWNFLGIWSIVAWFLLFAPIPFQRRMANGLHLPMVIISVIGFFWLINAVYKSAVIKKVLRLEAVRAFLMILFGLVLVSTTLYNVGQDIVILSTKPDLYYITKEEHESMLWLRKNVSQDELILSNPKTGILIPAISGRRVYAGHGHQTGNWIAKLAKVELWFLKTNNSDQQKLEWLKSEGIDYLFWGNREMKTGDFKPQDKNYLKPVYQRGKIVIYKVI
jgi:hypothetical protein